MMKIKGEITQIISPYQGVFNCKSHDLGIIKCKAPGFSPIKSIIIEGNCVYEVDPRYGGQYRFIENPNIIIERNPPDIMNQLIKILKGTGFGKVSAKKLYDFLLARGDPLEIMRDMYLNPNNRLMLKGHLNDNQIEILFNWWKEHEIKMELLSYGINTGTINKLDDNDISKIYNKPFTCYKITVATCLSVCKALNIMYTDDDIIARSIAEEVVNYRKSRYWTKIPISLLHQIKSNTIKSEITEKLLNDHNIDEINGFLREIEVTLKEQDLAKWFNDLSLQPKITDPDLDDWQPYDDRVTEEQRAAIKGALQYQCSIITGPAGTGKSKIIGEIAKYLEMRGETYVVTAFTGKATSRDREILRSICDWNEPLAYTMHSLISKRKFFKEKQLYKEYVGDNIDTTSCIPDKIIEAKYITIILDETSMVTGELLYKFLCEFGSAIKRLVLVGDLDQLEPFGNWGQPFKHLIEINKIPIFKLTTNFRSISNANEINGIIANAELIRNYNRESPVKLLSTDNCHHCTGDINKVMDIYKDYIQKGITREQIKILTPFNRDVGEINRQCQQIWAGDKRYVEFGENKRLYVADLVIMTENNYQIGVMNGEEGLVIDIDNQMNVRVQFPDKVVMFYSQNSIASLKLLNNKDINKYPGIEKLEPSYGLTVHRSQGSEYPYVILYCSFGHEIVHRNLIYTAITRAQKELWCVDTGIVIKDAITRNPPIRYEGFIEYFNQQ